MSKFLYMQDYHISGKNSVHYISDYFKDCLTMLDEILQIAKENKADAILDGGDLLHSSEPTYRILDEIADRVEKNKIPLYCLFGNHAERYHSIEHSKYTGLAHLFKRSKYFEYFDKGGLGSFSINQDNIKSGYEIKPIEYSHEIEQEIKDKGIMFEKSDTWKIAIVHAFLTPKPFLPQVMHVCVDDIKTNADLVLVAHYHNQWEKIVGDTKYLDIGCVGRRSITEKNVEPSVLLIDTVKRSAEVILLKSAKKGEDVFDLSKVDEKKDFDAGIDDFVKSIESVDFQSSKIEDNVSFIAKEKNVDKKVVDLIFKKIKELDIKDE